jgi:NAD(P)-dependent dehydrogenase (short-subunit alcohol dehydrogenase family)
VQILSGGTAVVTGAAGGIGRALAASFADRGMNVVLADLDGGLLAEVASALGGGRTGVLAVPTDVTDPRSVEELAAKAIASFGAVDIVCNNAGIVVDGLSWEIPLDGWQRILAVNLMGVVHGIRSFVPIMRSQNRGYVVNTASMAGVTSGPGLAAYAATKHAVVAVSEALYKELLSEGSAVRVSVVCPGMVATSMSAEAQAGAAQASGSASMPLALGDAIKNLGRNVITAERLADCVLTAIDDDQFWVFSHPERLAGISLRAKGMVEGINPGAAYA